MKKIKKIICSISLLMIKISLFAQESLLSTITETKKEDVVVTSLEKILGTILTIISSVYVKILAIVCCTMIGIRLILTKNTNDAMKKFIAFMIGCFLVVFTPDIIKNIFDISKNMTHFKIISVIQIP